MKKRNILIAVAIVVVGIVVWLIVRPSGKERIQLGTAAVSRITISNSVTATGTVEAVTQVDVGTQVSGIIDKLYADYNDHVKAGQLIAEMDKVTLQAELESAQAQLASSKTEYEYQTKNYARTRTLHEKELVSDAEYDEAFYRYETARNAYEESQAAMVKVKRNLGYATITSPIDGVVISRAVEEGQTVAAGFETPTLFTIANDLTQMQVVADVDEADIGQVADGQRVEFSVDAYPEDTFTGTVQQVRLEATTESNVVTYEVIIDAPNPDLKLKPGLTANVTIFTLEKENARAIPTRALRFVPDKEMLEALDLSVVEDNIELAPDQREVWVKQGTVLIPLAVRTGASSGDMTEITEGISDDDIVATELISLSPKERTAPAESRRLGKTPAGRKSRGK